jgi:hypothetical protein
MVSDLSLGGTVDGWQMIQVNLAGSRHQAPFGALG